MNAERIVRGTTAVALIALTFWIGGLLTLGAIVAPVVFGSVPFKLAADTMAVVFARYDKLAMGMAAILLASEAVRAAYEKKPRPAPIDVARIGLSVGLSAMAVLEGLWVTPGIARLHADGAVRGVGEAGERLASLHEIAETLGKTQALLAIMLIAVLVATVAPLGGPARAEPRSTGRERRG
jgi:hypothetical protein